MVIVQTVSISILLSLNSLSRSLHPEISSKQAKAAKKAKSVLASDISNEVVKKLKGVKCIKSDLFSNIKGKFDTIIFNPPYLPYDKREPKDISLATTGGKKGYELLERLIKEETGEE